MTKPAKKPDTGNAVQGPSLRRSTVESLELGPGLTLTSQGGIFYV